MRKWSGAAGVYINDNSKFLMVKQGTPEEVKRWSVPSGEKEENESIAECCIREVKEETGYDVEVVKPLWLKKYTTDRCHYEVQYFEIRIIGGVEKIQDPDQLIYEIGWKNIENFKVEELTYPGDQKLFIDLISNPNGVRENMIITDRCKLTKIDRLDYKNIKSLYTNKKVRKYLGGVQSEGKFPAIFDSYVDCHNKAWYWAIKDLLTDEFIGLVSIDLHHNKEDMEVSYQLLPEWWGQGIATEVVCEVLMYAFTHLQFSRVLAETQAANLASRKLLEKLQMEVQEELVRFNEKQVLYALSNPFT